MSLLGKNTDINKTIDLFNNKKVNFIVMIKNPYMWIKSISEFEKKSIDELYVIKKIKLWNEMYSNYKKYIEDQTAYLIKYEELLKTPNQILNKLIKKFNLVRKIKNSFELEKHKLGANSDKNLGKHTNKIFYPKKYINPNINKILSKNIINIINKNIDDELMSFYNYKIEI